MSDILVLRIKPSLSMLAFHIRALVSVPAALFPIQHPTNVPGKTENGPRVWVPARMWETRMKFLSPAFSLERCWPLQLFKE